MSRQQPSTELAVTRVEPGLSCQENALLNVCFPREFDAAGKEVWEQYQAVIAGLLVRMGRESRMLDSMARFVLVGTLDGVQARVSIIPTLGQSALHVLARHGVSELVYRLAGECALMELSAAAGYRTFCLPELVSGLLKTGKMKDRPVTRMVDTFEFLKTMMLYPYNDGRVIRQLARTNKLHAQYRVAGAESKESQELFKYIALNMFYIGPAMRQDLTPQERHAICGLAVLVSARMGHILEGSVHDFEDFIAAYEAEHMFASDDLCVLRRKAVEIAHASREALDKIPTISPWRIHSYVPYTVKQILEL